MLIRKTSLYFALAILFGSLMLVHIDAQTTAFSYQGKLTDAGGPANGTYIMQFSLWNAASGGTSLGTLSDLNVNALDGVFNVQLDFGSAAVSGNDLYLEFAVKKLPGDVYTTLSPRQQILSSPHAVKSQQASSSDDSAKLGGVDAARFVQSDMSGNVAVGGNLTVTGSTTFDTVNATTQFNLGGNRALASDNSGNLFVGTSSGTPPSPPALSELEPKSLAPANLNTVLGNWAGAALTTGGANTLVGYAAGNRNDAGYGNSFIGHAAGFLTTSGGSNTFIGNSAGAFNTTGLENSYFGAASGGHANVGNWNTFGGTYAGYSNHQNGNSFFGYKSGYANSSGIGNVFFGFQSGVANTVGSSNTFVGSEAGTDNIDGIFNVYVGESAGFNNVSGSRNVYVGARAGALGTGSNNSFFGTDAGAYNTADDNAVFGSQAGRNNTSGQSNAFFGKSSGLANTAGSLNSFYGANAGNANTLGGSNAFFGNDTGAANTTGDHLSLFGSGADFGVDGLTNATAIGANAVVSQSNSVVLGNNASVGVGTSTPTAKLEVVGDAKVSGAGNGVIFPDGTKQTTSAAAPGPVVTSVNGLNNAVTLAAGANVTITPSGNTLTIASTASSPAGILNQTTQQVGANFNIDGTGTANILDTNQFNTQGYRLLYSPGESTNLYVGMYTGVQGLGANDNTFVGTSTGRNTTTGGGNTFVGANAGYRNIVGNNNTFLGSDTGSIPTGSRNTLIGAAAGDGLQTGSNNSALGAFVHLDPNLNFATAIGAGSSVTTDNTIVIGRPTDTVSIPGTLTKAAGSFRIDHPIDPKNKYLYHSFVESPDMMNVYNGNIRSDANGEAIVELPAYFEALNKDFRYQLTVIGTFAQAIVSEEVSGNKFKIKTDKPNVKVSWQVTGIRKDPYAEKNRIVPEVEKPASEKGKLQNPEAYEGSQ